MNDVIFNMHDRILNGVDKLANAVQATLGPSGKNVIISKNRGYPLITKDGVTVARNITLSDDVENIGALMVKEAASKSNDLAGDGTTTATVLARSIFKTGMKYVASGHNPIDLKREIDKEIEGVVVALKEKAIQLKTEKQLYDVALVSTNGDAMLADLIAKAVWKVGKHGAVSVEDSKTSDTELKFVEGLQVERGLISKYFCNELTRMRAKYESPRILICNFELDSLARLRPALELALKSQIPLILFAHEFEDNLLAALIANKIKAGLKLVCLHTPGTGDFKLDYIEDLAKATGAHIFQPDWGDDLESVTLDHLGTCDQVISTFWETTFIGCNDVTDLTREIEGQIASCENSFLKEKLKDRFARLTSGIAILGLAAQSDTELKDMKLRTEDAINATRAAIEEGILPGGGLALYKQVVDSPLEARKILNEALKAPIKAILDNAGLSSQEILFSIDQFNNDNYGYDVRSSVHGNLLELGILDPLKVVRSSLQNAASVAGMLLTTAACIVKEEEKDV